jgi:hypothetical protein
MAGRPRRLGDRRIGYRGLLPHVGIVAEIAIVAVAGDIARSIRLALRLALAMPGLPLMLAVTPILVLAVTLAGGLIVALAVILTALLAVLWIAALALVALLPLAIALSLAVTVALAILSVTLGLVAVHAGHALAGRERGRETLADVLHIDVGNRQFAAADPRPLAVIHGGEHTVIVIGVLQVVLRRHAVAGGTRVTRELQILLQDLVGVATDPGLVATAIETLSLVMAPAHAVRFARATPTRASIVVVLLHMNVTSSSTVVEMAVQAARSSSRRIQQIAERTKAVIIGARRSLCAEALFGAGFALRWPAFPRARPMVSPDCRGRP